MRAGEIIEIEGTTALYRPHEKAVIRSLVAGGCCGAILPAAAWEQVTLLHSLKVRFEAVIPDEDEEALIRRSWEAFDAAAMPAEKAA